MLDEYIKYVYSERFASTASKFLPNPLEDGLWMYVLQQPKVRELGAAKNQP